MSGVRLRSIIENVIGREVLDSRGNPTVEAEVTLSDGSIGVGIAPSGASTGSREAIELRDGDKARFHGKGVLKAVENVNSKIMGLLRGVDGYNQRLVDGILVAESGSNKSILGANATLAVSIAVAKAAANSLKIPLYRYIGGANGHTMPVPMINIINGGAHAANALSIQEFMIMPVSAANMAGAIRMGSEIFHTLKNLLAAENLSTNVGDEGGFACDLASTSSAIEFILRAIEKAGYKPGEDVYLALDAAATEFYTDGKYHIDGKMLTTPELLEFYVGLCAKYPILSIEDPFDEGDKAGFLSITKALGERVQIVGDDLFCTNPAILTDGIKNGLANAVLVKPNQIGTLTETLDTIEITKRSSYKTIISHRSGESEDTTIAHIAVATNAGQIKTGSMSRTDRIAKYNELLRIEQTIGGSQATFGGLAAIRGVKFT